MSGVRLVLVDDHAGFRTSAAALLQLEGAQVVGTAATGEEGVAVVADLAPDAVLIDLFLPGIDGVAVAEAISAGGVTAPSLILISSHEDAASDPRVASAPVAGFLAKRDLTWSAIRHLLG